MAKHDEVGATWEEFLECAGAPVVVSGEFAPFGPGDLRRVDSVVTGVPEVPLELGLDYTITGVTNKGGVAAGADRSLGAAMAAESLKVNKFKADMVAAGLDFLPVAHETTGAMGPAARDRVFLCALALRGPALRPFAERSWSYVPATRIAWSSGPRASGPQG